MVNTKHRFLKVVMMLLLSVAFVFAGAMTMLNFGTEKA